MNLYIVWKHLLFLGINGLATLWSSRNIKSSKESSHLSDKQTCHLPEELLSFHTPRELLQLSRATALTPENVVLKENCSFKLLCMWRGESIARVVMECNLVHKYPVTEGCYQQVIQPGIEVVHDPLVKYLSRISGNLWVQVTGLDKVMSQVIFQICLLLVLTSHNQDRQQIQTANPLPSVLKCKHFPDIGLAWFSQQLAEIPNSEWAAGSENRWARPQKWEVRKFDEVMSYLSSPSQFSDTHIKMFL